jgi:trk system potassium uptake protein TrkH
MNLRPILFAIGLLLCVMSLSMLIPIFFDLYRGDSDWRVFCLCMALGLFLGGALLLSNHSTEITFNRRQIFLVIILGWLSAALLGSLPFVFSSLDLTFSEAFFEATSGVTTTGATNIPDLDLAPPGILIWRALLQWMGGIGTLLMALTVMPFLKIGGMQIFRAEQAQSENVLPQTHKLAGSIVLTSVVITLLCTLVYNLAGMGRFDALAHALTTISTGGFSTHNASIGYFENPHLQIWVIFFMICSAIPFIVLLKGFQGDMRAFLSDSQLKAYACLLILASVIIALYLCIYQEIPASDALLNGTFHTVSLLTTTGFTTANYNLWGGFTIAFFFFLMTIGGCGGSTSGGIKIFRFQIFFSIIRQQVRRLFFPHGVFAANYNGQPIPPDAPLSVVSFLFLYAACFAGLSLALAFTGVDTMTALSGAMASLSNTGPGLGDLIGPAGNYSALPEDAKWILCLGMFLGRLEIIPVLILMQPLFWKH